jgi:site-specific recombinase XerD
MKDTFSTLVYLKSKSRQDELVPIYVRITVRGQRAEISLKREVLREKWNTLKGRLSGTSDKVKSFNHYLNTVEYKIEQAYYHLIQNDTPISARAIKNKYLGIADERKGLLEVFDYHNSKMEQLIGIEFAKSTVTKYKTSLKHLTKFIKLKYHTDDVLLCDMSRKLISDFQFYLTADKGIGVNTSNKYLLHLKSIVDYAVDYEWLNSNPFSNFKLRDKKVIKEFLSSLELGQLINTKYSNEFVQVVADIFIFCCLTGLSFIDVKGLTNDNILISVDGNTWVHINRQKTGETSRVPLTRYALDLSRKYKEHASALINDYVFPVLSNQKMNQRLKEVATEAGISKNLTMHVARHTFATSTLTMGVPLESVGKMLGHKSLKTTQIYAKIQDSKIISDMALFLQDSPREMKKHG